MKYQINLLPPKNDNLADKLIFFAFHYLRYILVITQLVVICVFFYRFRVDQDIIDLKDSIKQKQEIIKTVEPLLNEVKLVNGKIDNIKVEMNKQNQFNELYTYFLSRVPDDLILSALTVSLDGIDCEGVTESTTSVKMFYEELSRDKRFASVQLLNVRKAQEGEETNATYTFALKLQGFKYENGL